LKELQSYQADIICLQECDKKTFELYLHPYFNYNNIYQGFYTEKSGRVPEGCAIFIKQSTFLLRKHFGVSLKDIFESDPNIGKLFALRPDVYDISCLKLGTICQIEVLQHRQYNDQIIIVGNTHLFYHPHAAYIRLLQVYAIMKTMCAIKGAIESTNGFDFTLESLFVTDSSGLDSMPHYSSEEESLRDTLTDKVEPINYKISVIFAGDLNSTPETGVIEYLNRYALAFTYCICVQL